MKSGDMPASPCKIWQARYGSTFMEEVDMPGLTKRERFAMAAMQGMLVNHEQGADYELEDLPASAVQFADALLAELERTTND